MDESVMLKIGKNTFQMETQNYNWWDEVNRWKRYFQGKEKNPRTLEL